MTNNRWDGTLNGVRFRLRRGEGAYNRFFSRQQVEEQFVLPAGERTSRSDQMVHMQTNWADGATWFRPLLKDGFQASYQFAQNMDMLREPGTVLPLNQRNADTRSTRGMETDSPITNVLNFYSGAGVGPQTTVVGVSSTAGTNRPLRYWNHSTGDWADSTGTVGSVTSKWQLINIGSDIYALDDTYISWTDGTSTTDDDAVAVSPRYGASIAPGLLGQVYFYDGDVLHEVDTVGKTLTTVTDDGLGPTIRLSDWADYAPQAMRHCIGTTEGVYYMKNIWAAGGPQCWVYRVERDAAGNIFSTPLATLPVGNLGLSLGWVLGTPIILTTDDWAHALGGESGAETGPFTTQLWSLFGGTQGVLGSFNYQEPTAYTIDRAVTGVYSILGTFRGGVVLGGSDFIWVYDPVRGGAHSLFKVQPQDKHNYNFAVNADNDRVILDDDYFLHPRGGYDYPESDFGGIENNTYYVYSNWFDFNLPGEQKTITGIKTRITDYNQRATAKYVLDLFDSDAAKITGFPTGIAHDHFCDNQELETTGLSLTSERFFYRLQYRTDTGTGSSAPPGLVGVWFTAATGEVVQGWQLTIDGTEFLNVENEEQVPEEVFDAWVTLGQTEAAVTFEDNFESYDREDKTSHTVRIQGVQVQKAAPGEAYVQVTLIDAG